MLTFGKCTDLPRYMGRDNTVNVYMGGELYGRVFKHGSQFLVCANPNKAGEWQNKKLVNDLDEAGTELKYITGELQRPEKLDI